MPEISQIQVGDTSYDIKDEISGYQTEDQVDTKLESKQDTLVSGETIKTINGESILGSGNIEIQGGGGGSANDGKLTLKRNGTVIGSFTANQLEDIDIDINVPIDDNELLNGAGYITNNDISSVAKTGNYNDLNNKPDLTIFAKDADLGAVAKSNDYNDLNNKYQLPNATQSTLGGVKQGNHVSISSGILSGIVDTELDDTSNEAIANKVVAEKFAAVDEEISTINEELPKKALKQDPVFVITKDADGNPLDEPVEFSICVVK